jgi:tetratricopeptide (TPR) repeat protein
MSTEEPHQDALREERSRHQLDVDSILGSVVQAGSVQGGLHIHPKPEEASRGRVALRQLPAPNRGFVNRVREVAELDELLDQTSPTEPHPVIVIVGSGGIGKTALALHWAHRIRSRFTDGDLFVNLHGYGADQPVPATAALERILRALGVAAEAIPVELEDRAALFRSLVAGRRLLIFADNASSAQQVRPLIPGGPGPLLIVTSRSRMPSLAVRDGVGYVHVDVLHEEDAVALVETVTGRRRDDHHDQVSELVNLCARLPLALRIAAERAVASPWMDLAELIGDLRDTSGLWEVLSVDDGAEVDDVRTVFAWSYRAMPATAAWVFRVLGLHPGIDMSLPALAAAADMSLRQTRRAVDMLVGAFLVEPHPGARFQMHDLLRAYAHAESQANDSPETIRAAIERMAAWYTSALDTAAERLPVGPGFAVDAPPDSPARSRDFASEEDALVWWETERRNLVAVTRLAQAAELPHHALALALTFSTICMSYLDFNDWDSVSDVALRAAATTEHPLHRATAEHNRGMYLFRRGDYAEAEATLERARRFYETAGDRHGAAVAQNASGLVNLHLRHLSRAAGQFAAAAEAFARQGEHDWENAARTNLAHVHVNQGELRPALDELPDLIAFFERIDDRPMYTNALNRLAEAHRLNGDPARAKTTIDTALADAERRRAKVEEGMLLLEAARIQLVMGNPSAALESSQLSAALHRQLGDKSREMMAHRSTADALLALDRAEEALAFYLRAAEQFHDRGEAWNEALAYLGSADAAAALERLDAEQRHLERALERMTPFDDPHAHHLEQRIAQRLRNDHRTRRGPRDV